MGNRYSRCIQIYKTKLIITWYTVFLLTDSSVDELPSFCKLSYNLKSLENTIGMFQLKPTQKLRQDHKLKTKFRIYFSTSLP